MRGHKREMPVNFLEMAATGMSVYSLCKHYNVHHEIIERWLSELRERQDAYDRLNPAMKKHIERRLITLEYSHKGKTVEDRTATMAINSY